MKTNKGSTIGLVLIATLAIGITCAGVVRLITVQRRLAAVRELQFQANNLAETALDYAFAFIANDVKRKGSVTASAYIPSSGNQGFDFSLTPEALTFLTGDIAGPSSFTDETSRIQFTNVEVRLKAPAATIDYTVNSTDPRNRLSDFRNQKVFETTVPVVAKVTATMGGYSAGPSGGFTNYIQKNIAIREVPMFQKAIFFQSQLHLHRGYPIMGGVHTNGNLAINAHGDDTATYNGLVTAAGRFYRGSTFDAGGKGTDPYGYAPELPATDASDPGGFDFSTSYTEPIDLVAQNDDKLKIITSDPTILPAAYELVLPDLDSRTTDWKTTALSRFKGNLLDKSHGVARMVPPGCRPYVLDAPSTSTVNEFDNGSYSLIQPYIADSTHPGYTAGNIYNFSSKASLYFRVECMKQFAPTTTTTQNDTTAQSYKWIVKAYKQDPAAPGVLTPLPLPAGVMGQTKIRTAAAAAAGSVSNQYYIATSQIAAGGTEGTKEVQGLFEEFHMVGTSPNFVVDTNSLKFATANPITGYRTLADNSGAISTNVVTENIRCDGPAHGFFDSRLGRGVSPVTIDIGALKNVLNGTDTSEAAVAFRTSLGVGTTAYTGLVYVEFPTSMRTVSTLSTRVYKTGTTPYPGDMAAVDSYAFALGHSTDIETRHPDRMSDTDSTRVARTDKVLPIAKGLRGYPNMPTYDAAVIAQEQWAIPALQLVDGRKLPTVSGVTGLTIATNAPLYLVGSYNCDGNFSTGTNITGTLPTDYAVNDSSWGEVSAGLFSDTLTILSDTWGNPTASTRITTTTWENKGTKKNPNWVEVSTTTTNYTATLGAGANRFQHSFAGSSNASDDRIVRDGQVEIAACIITGEYPIFEFFLHALENWGAYYNGGSIGNNSPICIKGAVIGMFHSEIQHIKNAYGRDPNIDIQMYYTGHGNSAIPAVRIHSQLINGVFPPGTPKARDYGQNQFQFLRPSKLTDAAEITSFGFTAP